MVDSLSLRPTMSMVATLLIATGCTQAVSHDCYGFALITAGCGLYLLKAYLYKNGYFFDKEDKANDSEGD